ncbi:MAG: metallophosphoesterase [Candidatus Bathyarchaeia archaeon]|nr:metallophosphoesterase [Candidatus Bathyarchaeota archaeon]
MSIIKLAATADIHAPRYTKLFEYSLSNTDLSDVDILLLAGDIVLHNDYRQMDGVISKITEFYDGPIYACFGNEEYHGYETEYRRLGKIVWLDDESSTISLNGLRIGIVGSRGALDSPTNWQRKFRPDIKSIYANKPSLMVKLLSSLNVDLKIVLTHYSPTYKTLRGEDPNIWVYLGCKAMEPTIAYTNIWIHGHAHKGMIESIKINGIPVYNVSLPARKRIVIIEVRAEKKSRGLDGFFAKY